ncbi:MAG: hypothetical protein KBS75_02210, partial [Bacteroidales bacterium]|nr:hypothetical protein [Candidatus Equimonas faecalis]
MKDAPGPHASLAQALESLSPWLMEEENSLLAQARGYISLQMKAEAGPNEDKSSLPYPKVKS